MKTFKINIENTNAEVLARIMKSTASKYDCSVDIDFSDGRRDIEFIGDEEVKRHVIEEVADILLYDTDGC